MNKKKLGQLILGPVIFIVCCLFLPHSIFTTLASRAAIGTVLWVSLWWILRPVDLAVAALLPIAVNVFIEIAPMEKVISNFASETILLVAGASILGVTMEVTGLGNRIALFFLSIIGEKIRTQLIFWFILSTLLSAILPNVVVCASLIHIAISILRTAGITDIKNSKIGAKLLLYISYGVSVGGLLSPLGGAMNLVTVDYLEQVTGSEFMYYVWVIRFLPIIVVLVISNIIYMLRDVKKEEDFPVDKQSCIEEYKKLPKITREEKLTMVLFLGSLILTFVRPLYAKLLPNMKPAYIFLICGMLAFFITNSKNELVMKWKTAEQKILWSILIIFGGGLALGTLLSASGAATEISTYVSKTGLSGGFITVLVIVSLTIILSDITSNTATAAVIIPIVISIAEGLNMNPIPWIYIATIGVNISYSLPTSIRAIPVGYGLEPKYMFKEGWKLSIIVILLMSIISYLLLRFWPAFSTI